ncbi:hypothetical protein HMPREF1508_1334 [Shuttleworthella sp. MSX8B]|nr:hypothetical protein HMPREF1508_1334 [Shuttleworthia sp. MSX8B]
MSTDPDFHFFSLIAIDWYIILSLLSSAQILSFKITCREKTLCISTGGRRQISGLYLPDCFE